MVNQMDKLNKLKNFRKIEVPPPPSLILNFLNGKRKSGKLIFMQQIKFALTHLMNQVEVNS